VRDGINLARRGIPVVCLVTTKFRAQGDFVARAAGMPDVPRVVLPHPVAGTGRDAMRKLGVEVAGPIVGALTGSREASHG